MQIKITDNIFVNGTYKDTWGNSGIILEKYGKEKKINPRLKETHISLENYDKNISFKENQKMGNILTIPQEEWIQILEKVGYITQISDNDIKKMVEKFAGSDSMVDYYYDFKKLANEEEIKLFHEWEEEVGYIEESFKPFDTEYIFKKYNNNLEKIDGYVHVIKNSTRWLNAFIYLKTDACRMSEYNLEIVYNYLFCYNHRDKVIEVDYYDEWKGNTNLPTLLLQKYNIPNEKIDYENRSFCNRYDASVFGSNDSEYILVDSISASVDDWTGECAVLKNTCDLKPFEFLSFARSIYSIENNMFVKLQKIKI